MVLLPALPLHLAGVRLETMIEGSLDTERARKEIVCRFIINDVILKKE